MRDASATLGITVLFVFPTPARPTFAPMHTLDQLRTGQLTGTKRLDLSEGLTEFPTEIFA